MPFRSGNVFNPRAYRFFHPIGKNEFCHFQSNRSCFLFQVRQILVWLKRRPFSNYRRCLQDLWVFLTSTRMVEEIFFLRFRFWICLSWVVVMKLQTRRIVQRTKQRVKQHHSHQHHQQLKHQTNFHPNLLYFSYEKKDSFQIQSHTNFSLFWKSIFAHTAFNTSRSVRFKICLENSWWRIS